MSAESVSDAGLACCADTGATCDGGQDTCCGMCMDGQCACAPVTNECTNNAGCCPGEACMTRASGGNVNSPLACCQMIGSFCVPNVECCSGLCVNLGCICVPDGGLCGEPGLYAAAGAAACCSGICGDAGVCN